MVKTGCGLHDSLESAIDAEWNRNVGKMDWVGMENCLAQFLRSIPYERQTIELYKIDEIVAAFTKRGHNIAENPGGTLDKTP